MEWIWDFVISKIYPYWAPVLEWMFLVKFYLIGGVAELIILAICFYVPINALRWIGGWLTTIMGAFLAGMTLMFIRDREIKKEQEALNKRVEQQPKQGDWFKWN